MFNHIRFIERLLLRRGVYYAINVGGLAVGIASCLLVIIYVNQELSYDSFHNDADRLYRIEAGQSRTPVPLVPEIQNSIPDVEAATRLIFTTSGTSVVVSDLTGELHEENLYFADSTFFDIFSFGVIAGDVEGAIGEAQNLVITKRTALKYFNSTDVVGRELEFVSSFFQDKIFRITAVVGNTPPNSQFQFDMLISFKFHGTANNQSWNSNYVMSFVKVKKGAEERVLDQIRKLYGSRSSSTEDQRAAIKLQPLTELHFSQTTSFDFLPRNKKENLWVLLTIGFMVFGIALINFINMSSLKSFERVKEVVVRRALGASQRQLATQFLLESVCVTTVAFLIGLLVVYTALPFCTNITGVDFSYAFGAIVHLLYWLPIASIVLGLVCGWYPCLVISRFRAFTGLKASKNTSSGFRMGVVTVQFAITTFFVFGTLIVFRQMKFIQERDLGFDMSNALVLNVGGPGVGERLNAIRNELLKHKSIQSVSASLTVPGDNIYRLVYSIPGASLPDQNEIAILYVDEQFIDNVGLEMFAGTTFTGDPAADSMSIVINRTAADQLLLKYGKGWEDPVSRIINQGYLENGQWQTERALRIIGVVEDFNLSSLHHKLAPVGIRVDPNLYYKLLVKVDHYDVPNTIEYISQKWKEAGIERPFTYQFLNHRFEMTYRKDKSFESVFVIFSVISIIVGVLGLYSLVLFVVETKKKEVSIRKVLGASILHVVIYVAKFFYRPIVIGFVVFSPVALVVMNHWLAQFAYKVDVSVITIVLSGLFVFLIATLTVMFKTVAVGRSNPVKYLRE